MAIQISYTNEYGDVWPESFWVLSGLEINRRFSNAQLRFTGYKNAAAYIADPNGIKAFSFEINNTRTTLETTTETDENGDESQIEIITTHMDYTDYFDKLVLNPEEINPYKKAYEAALALIPMFAGGVKV